MTLSRIVLATFIAGTTIFLAHGANAADRVLARSGFDADLEGWTASQDEVTWSAKGGHPGGRMVFNGTLTGPNCYVIAPNTFLAANINYKKLDGKAYFSWQQELVEEKSITTVYNYEMRISGPGGSATFDGGQPPLTYNKWFTVVAPIDQANWVVTSGTWAALLTDVENIQVNIELIGSGEGWVDVEAMDNFEVVSHPKGFNPK